MTESSSRFKDITFKAGVKVKGRPRKRGKQVSFKRTQADKQAKKDSQRVPRKKVKPTQSSDRLPNESAAESEDQLPIFEQSTDPFLQSVLSSAATISSPREHLEQFRHSTISTSFLDFLHNS